MYGINQILKVISFIDAAIRTWQTLITKSEEENSLSTRLIIKQNDKIEWHPTWYKLGRNAYSGVLASVQLGRPTEILCPRNVRPN